MSEKGQEKALFRYVFSFVCLQVLVCFASFGAAFYGSILCFDSTRLTFVPRTFCAHRRHTPAHAWFFSADSLSTSRTARFMFLCALNVSRFWYF
tara:strand:+ start:9674 stop:9955 length:282 start_codon:yes stop_codon:yes gene_type:complete